MADLSAVLPGFSHGIAPKSIASISFTIYLHGQRFLLKYQNKQNMSEYAIDTIDQANTKQLHISRAGPISG